MAEIVKIIVSHSHGSGFSTCNKEFHDIEKDVDIIAELEKGDFAEAISVCERKYPGAFAEGLKHAHVESLNKGVMYKITAYDGLETLDYKYDEEWKIA